MILWKDSREEVCCVLDIILTSFTSVVFSIMAHSFTQPSVPVHVHGNHHTKLVKLWKLIKLYENDNTQPIYAIKWTWSHHQFSVQLSNANIRNFTKRKECRPYDCSVVSSFMHHCFSYRILKIPIVFFKIMACNSFIFEMPVLLNHQRNSICSCELPGFSHFFFRSSPLRSPCRQRGKISECPWWTPWMWLDRDFHLAARISTSSSCVEDATQ